MYRILTLMTLVSVECYIVTNSHQEKREVYHSQIQEKIIIQPPEIQEKMRITPPEPSHVMVKEGDNVTLTCSGSHSWFLCLWVHPGPDGDKLCSIQEDGLHTPVCQGVPGAELVVTGDRSCNVHLTNVTQEEAGDWMCLLSQAGVYHTDRVMTSLSVAKPTVVNIGVSHDIIDNNIPQDVVGDDSEDVLNLIEDASITIECTARGGYPQPQLHWALVQDVENMIYERLGEEVTIISQQNQSNVVTSSVKYSAKLTDSGKTLVCISEQFDIYTNGLLYNITGHMTLSISAKASPLQAYLTEQQDVVAGVVISCFLIIFCIIIVIIFTVRSNKSINPPTKLIEESKAHESYIIFLEEPSGSRNTSNTSNSMKGRNDDKESGIDVSHGDFVSFSSSDMYSISKSNNSDNHAVILSDETDSSNHQSSATDDNTDNHDDSSDACAASDGGLSNISVFDCQHGCFHDEEDDHHQHHYHHHQDYQHQIYKEPVLNTDL